MSAPLVSAITVFLDEERFLEDAIESVIAQQYEDWELLLVDDGSTDRGTEIARRHASEHGRIRYFDHARHENRGMSVSRNLALEHAVGEYVAFIDADDVWYPDTLTRQVALLERQREAALAYGTALWWRSWAGADAGDSCDVVAARVPDRDGPIDPPDFATLIVRDGAAVPCPCTVIVRTHALRGVGGFEDSFRGLYEDQVLYAKIGLEWPVVLTSDCLGRYRQHEGQCCVRAAREGTVGSSHARFLAWLGDYARRRCIAGDSSFWNALHDAQASYGLELA